MLDGGEAGQVTHTAQGCSYQAKAKGAGQTKAEQIGMPRYHTEVRKAAPVSKSTSMKAIADQAHRGMPPESELRTHEFGNGRVQKKNGPGAYDGKAYNAKSGLFE